MRFLIFCTILFIFDFKYAAAMAIDGPMLTRYDPCGLGVIHFDRLTENTWQGVLQLDIYQHLAQAKVEIWFEKNVTISGVSRNSNFSTRSDRYELMTNGSIPKKFTFYVTDESHWENNTGMPIVTQFALNDVVLCNDAIKASQTAESLDVTEDSEKYAHVCGRRSMDNTELISVKTEAKAGEWPWHVAILLRDPETKIFSYYCGGNIISRLAIVTAGHCVFKNGVRIAPEDIMVIAGVNNHRETGQIGRQSFIATDVILHPGYSDTTAAGDLAIIKVNKLQYTDYVQPICVWGPVYNKADLIGREATVVGFGHDSNDKPSDVLRSAYITVQNDSTCIDYSPEVYTNLLTEFSFCAGYGPTSATNPRNGDSGGGIVFPVLQPDHKVSWFLRGVLSKCGVGADQTACTPTFYVVYTDVGPHYGWIYHHSGLRFGTNILN